MTSSFSEVGGVSFEKIVELGKLTHLAETTVYVSGSLIEGFGNSLSDIDIFVISDDMVKGEILTERENYHINIVFYKGRRIDYEFYKPGYIKKLREKLEVIKVGEEFVAEKLDPHEELFIHRLKIGIPIISENKFLEFQKMFDYAQFKGYLIQQCIHMIDGAIEDITGCVDDSKYDTACLRCLNMVGTAVDLYCYFNDCTNTLPKWRFDKLKSLQGKDHHDYVSTGFWDLTFPKINANDEMSIKEYINSSLTFANNIIEFVQS